MATAARPLDAQTPDLATSTRHRTAAAESFPTSDHGVGVDYEPHEAALLRSLLAEPLDELARSTTDSAVSALAEHALGTTASGDLFADLARLEDALEKIASTAADVDARAFAANALALYRGR